MCGRYRLSQPTKLAEFFEAEADADFGASFNVAPTQSVAAVRVLRDHRVLSTLRWGLVPFWAHDAAMGNQLINARSESVLDKPAFREAFRRRRCLIPADGFYEWKRSGKTKRPFHFGLKDGSLFAFAGIWDRWQTPEQTTLESCSILTTSANALVGEIHNRMPVILPQSHYDAWLVTPPEQAEGLLDLLVPFDAGQMRKYEVSSLVNRPQNDSPECVEEVSEKGVNLELWG
jgi:putative SOS response-associated peptidase YedK